MTRKVLDPKWLRMMHTRGLQIYLRPCVALIFDLLTPKVDRFMSLLCGPLVPICIKVGSSVDNRRMDGQVEKLWLLPVWPGGGVKIQCHLTWRIQYISPVDVSKANLLVELLFLRSGIFIFSAPEFALQDVKSMIECVACH